jgi:hypothetical protein
VRHPRQAARERDASRSGDRFAGWSGDVLLNPWTVTGGMPPGFARPEVAGLPMTWGASDQSGAYSSMLAGVSGPLVRRVRMSAPAPARSSWRRRATGPVGCRRPSACPGTTIRTIRLPLGVCTSSWHRIDSSLLERPMHTNDCAHLRFEEAAVTWFTPIVTGCRSFSSRSLRRQSQQACDAVAPE